MGDQRRSDSDKAEERESAPKPERDVDRDGEDREFDGEHAKVQLAYHAKRMNPDTGTSPVHRFDAVGGLAASETHFQQYEAAKTAKSAAQVLDVVRDMDTTHRDGVKKELSELAVFCSGRDVITIAGLCSAEVAPTVLAVLAANPPITRPALRAYFADIGYYELVTTFDRNPDVVSAMRARFPGSPMELLVHIGENGILSSPAILKWLIETTPPRTVARMVLQGGEADWYAQRLNELGDIGWEWLDAVDGRLAAIAPATLAKYREAAAKHKGQEDTHDTPAPAKIDSSALRSQCGQVIAKSSPLELQEQMQIAGMSPAEQLEWILDKPRVTPEQIREATAVMETTSMQMSPALVAKLQRHFPKGAIEDIFSGEIPLGLVKLGARDTKVATWLLRAAEPETILRICTASPDLIDEWCAKLVETGVGYAWVRQLGGFTNDRWLRRFVVKCPDAPTREYIQQRVLGHGEEIETRAGAISAPTAYTSAASHLDADLAQANGKKPVSVEAGERNASTVAADVEDLDDKEIDALRRDPSRLRQVFADATPKRFVQILDQVQPELQVAVLFATSANVTASHLASWAQARPVREIVTTMSSAMLVDRLTDIVGDSFGPLELFPAIASPAHINQILQHNPSFMEWLLSSDPTTTLRSIANSATLDLAVRALAKHADLVEATWPLADALGTEGRSVLVQLAARAKGALRDVLENKLSEKLPNDEDETPEERDRSALMLRDANKLTERVKDAVALKEGSSNTLIALCRSTPDAARLIANDPDALAKLRDSLSVGPEIAFSGTPLSTLLATGPLLPWVFASTPPTRILGAITEQNATVVAAVLTNGPDAASDILHDWPRGRALTRAQKATLHKLALVGDDATFTRLFGVTFDTTGNTLPRAELEKTWKLLERLPEAHVDQHSISSFVGLDGQADNGTAGVYYPDTKDIKVQNGMLETKTKAPYDQHFSMTEEQAIEALGSRDDLNRFVAENRIVQNSDGSYSFVQKEQIDLFPQTVLHEVGHAVDYMLGARTELIYELVGWKQFSSADVDGWARQLGHWDKVKPSDQRQIRDLWVSWLSGGGAGAPADMVDKEHPVHAAQYTDVGAVRLAHNSMPHVATEMGHNVAMANPSDQAFYTLSQKGYYAAPSAYSLTAPAEYFAECYANYYREYDGTAKTAKDKGASLAPWIKRWFDANIDGTGHNPRR
jgi:hypothetical protein